jgi:hypothetical protein
MAIFALEGFQSLEGFLAVVQAGGSDMDGKIFVRRDFQFPPCAVFEMTSHIVIGLHDTEAKIFPVKFHIETN